MSTLVSPIEHSPPIAVDTSPLLSALTEFLTLSLHSLLYHRGLYPQAVFLIARALNLSAPQARNPILCNWINNAVAAIKIKIQQGAGRRIFVVMHAPNKLEVLERWVFDVEMFPDRGDVPLRKEKDEEDDKVDHASKYDAGIVTEGSCDGDDRDIEDEEHINQVDVTEALRGALLRICFAAKRKPQLPQKSTCTLAIDFRDQEPTSIGNHEPWIQSRRPTQLDFLHGDNFTTEAIYSIEVGNLRLYVGWSDVKLDKCRRQYLSLAIEATGLHLEALVLSIEGSI